MSASTVPAFQHMLALALPPVALASHESQGVVYTKQWVVELLLDLAGYTPDKNLVDSLAVEPSAGDGAFLGSMAERLVVSCTNLGRPLQDCADSLIAFELNPESALRARTLVKEILARHCVEASLADTLAQSWVKPATI
jgi:adenine-specific DNA-methyltransferase